MQKKSLLILSIILVVLIVLYVSITSRKTSVPTSNFRSTSELTFDTLLDTQIVPIWNEDELITLKKGKYEGRYDVSDVSAAIGTDNTSYASTDLNGDGNKDLLAIIGSNSGGTGYFSELMAFLNIEGTPKYAGKLFLGDRIVVNSIIADKNIVTVDIITQGPGEAFCCGTMRQVKKYSFSLVDGFKEIKSEYQVY